MTEKASRGASEKSHPFPNPKNCGSFRSGFSTSVHGYGTKPLTAQANRSMRLARRRLAREALPHRCRHIHCDFHTLASR